MDLARSLAERNPLRLAAWLLTLVTAAAGQTRKLSLGEQISLHKGRSILMYKHLLRAGALLLTACALLVTTASANSIDFYGNTPGGDISFNPAPLSVLTVTN